MDNKKVFDEKFNEDIYKSDFYSKKYTKVHSKALTKKLFKYLDFIKQQCFTKLGELSVRGYYSLEPLSFNDKTMGDQLRLNIGSSYAKNPFDSIWLNLSGTISEDINTDDVVFDIDINGEGIVVDNNGKELQAISNYSNDYDNNLGTMQNSYVVNNDFITNGQISFWIDAGYNRLGKNTATINKLDILLMNKQIVSLYYDLQVIVSLYNYAPTNYTKIIEAKLNNLGLFEIVELNEENIAKIKETFSQIIEKENFDEVFNIFAVGNSNQNIGWLCPVKESYRKAERAFINQIYHLNLYPNYIFGASQAQLYQWIKDKNPALFEQIKQKVKEGRWEIQGATWVDMDSTVIGLESLIRQIYYGKKFFLDEFNVDSKIMWQQSSNGVSNCLPELMQLSNIPYLVVNQFDNNKMQTFNFEGHDKSTVLTHALIQESVNSPATIARMNYIAETYNEKQINSSCMMLVGMSNGSLGVGYEHLERAKRLNNVQPLPKLTFKKAVDFFDKATNVQNNFETYDGFIKLDKCSAGASTYHYTKYFNRKIELLLKNYEILVAQLGLAEEELPISHSDLEKIWKEVLLYESQKIISGDSIGKVYEDIIVKYDVIYNKLKYSIGELLKNCKSGNFMYNPNSFEYEHIYNYNDKWYSAVISPFTALEMDKGTQITAYYGIAGDSHIENKMYRICFENGEIVSIYDKFYNKEFVKKDGSMMSYQVYVDKGTQLDYNNNFEKLGASMRCVGFVTVKNGPITSAKIALKKGKIKIDEVVSITDGKEGIDVNIKVSCFAKNKMLVCNLDSNIVASEYSINNQIGYNTVKANSKFTTNTCDKFIDLSNSNYGVTLITDCKYGFINNNENIKVCLLRSPKGSTDRIDNGNCEINMQIYPHHSKMDINSFKQAYIVNNPIIEAFGSKKATIKKLFSDNENVIIESVKTFKNGNAIVRVYNASNKKQTVNIKFGRRQQKKIVDIMENKIGEVKEELVLKPFELVNLLFD